MQEVVVGVLVENGRMLIGRRRRDTRYEGTWEFPGGKIEAGEDAADALRRELREELRVEAGDIELLTTVEHRYDDGGQFHVRYYLVRSWRGEIRPAIWDEYAWVTPSELERYPIFEANRRIIGHLHMRLANDDERYMLAALELAHSAAQKGEVPVGCVVVRDGAIIGTAHNRTEELRMATAHAEQLAIADAMRRLGSKLLDGCTLYVTLEPCPMCAGAIVLARIERVVFGAHDPKAGACETLYTLTADRRLNHRAKVRGGVLADRAQELLQEFFQRRREQQ